MARNEGFTFSSRAGAEGPAVTLLEHLARRHPHTSPGEWRSRIEAGRVLVDGAIASPDAPLARGRRVSWLRPPWDEPDAPVAYRVLLLDADLLAVDKPAGLPTLPGAGFLETTLLRRVRREIPDAAPVHRLGRFTSGVVLFARSARARAGLSRQWAERTVVKRYRALASGEPARERFRIDVPIGPVPHERLGTVHAALAGGRPSSSEVAVVRRRRGEFLCDVWIATGRPHQIRIHLAAAGHPLVGDPLYAAGGRPSPGATALPGDPGYLLHAAELTFRHPAGGGLVTVESDPPDELV